MNIELLKRLCETPGVPGREERVRALIEREIKGLFDEVRTDPMGSLHCTRRARPSGSKGEKRGKGKSGGGRPTRVLLMAHMDEIGFYVKHIDDKGYVRVQNAGGFDTRNLFARRVRVSTREHGDIFGAMNPGGRPIHIASEEDKKKIPDIKEFIVDLGMPVDKVRKMVSVGDMVTLDAQLTEVGDKIVSKCLDDRLSCWAAIEALRAIEKSGASHAAEIHVVFTVQEEVGLRGAHTSSYAVEPDIALGLDVTLSCDTPGVPDDERVTRQGDGVGLHVMDSSFIADHELINDLERVAKRNKIPCQRTILARGGQDGAAGQMARAGARAAGIVIGIRNIHTVTEMADKRDAKSFVDLLAAYLPTVA